MTGKNRHNKYRKSIYRRRSVGIIILVSVICLSVMLTAFLIIGNLLHKQSEKRNDPSYEDTEISSDNLSDEKMPVKSIKAYSVLLETQDSSVFSSRLDALVRNGIYEASVPLNTSDGKLLFKSDVASKIGYPNGEANVTLSKAVSSAKENNIYLSGIYYLNAFKNSDPLVRSVELSRAGALISEALNAGFDDVIVIAPEMTNAQVDEAIRFIEDIRSLTNGGIVGLCVSDSILSTENSQELSNTISALDSKIDILAIDASSEYTLGNYGTIGDKIGTMQQYILMYKMRVLLPNATDSDSVSAIINEAESNGVKNIQFLP